MEWINFPVFAGITFLSWIVGLTLVYSSGKRKSLELAGQIFILAGIVTLTLFVVLLWLALVQPLNLAHRRSALLSVQRMTTGANQEDPFARRYFRQRDALLLSPCRGLGGVFQAVGGLLHHLQMPRDRPLAVQMPPRCHAGDSRRQHDHQRTIGPAYLHPPVQSSRNIHVP